MTLDKILEFISNENKNRPNKITIYIGEAIRKAREGKGLSQTELAKMIYLRRATLSDIENGKSEPDASILMLLGHVLEKPVAYFLPDYLYIKHKEDELSPLESELLMLFRNVWSDQLKRLVMQQVQIVADFEPDELIINNIELISEKYKIEDETIELIKKRKNLK